MVSNYSGLALRYESKLDPRVLEAMEKQNPGPGPLLVDFALRVLRNLDTVSPSEDGAEMFLSAVTDLAEDLRRNLA
jgi:hypothetical protein